MTVNEDHKLRIFAKADKSFIAKGMERSTYYAAERVKVISEFSKCGILHLLLTDKVFRS